MGMDPNSQKHFLYLQYAGGTLFIYSCYYQVFAVYLEYFNRRLTQISIIRAGLHCAAVRTLLKHNEGGVLVGSD